MEREGGKGFTPESLDWMARRTLAFQRATTRWPGKQMTYGAGKGPLWDPKDWPDGPKKKPKDPS